MSTQGGTQEGFRCVYVLPRPPKFMCTPFHKWYKRGVGGNDKWGGWVEGDDKWGGGGGGGEEEVGEENDRLVEGDVTWGG